MRFRLACHRTNQNASARIAAPPSAVVPNTANPTDSAPTAVVQSAAASLISPGTQFVVAADQALPNQAPAMSAASGDNSTKENAPPVTAAVSVGAIAASLAAD